MKIINYALAAGLLIGCSADRSKNSTVNTVHETAEPVYKEHFKAGEVVEKIICNVDTSQSYALYLPSTYSPEKNNPVIFAFDPHGTGNLPVATYKALAEKYKFILVGSNNSKNGTAWEDILKITTILFSDVQSRLNVNPQRIYLLGFSGGARIANGIARNNGSITGVICCGAAAPASGATNPRTNYFFMGITGNEDFNYTEIKKYDKVELAGHSVKHALLEFDGKHEWPPLATMDQAFWWMELNEMRKNNGLKKNAHIPDSVQLALAQLKILLDQKRSMEAYECCRKTINFYDGLTDLSTFFTTYKTLQTDQTIDAAMKREEQEWKQEEDIKKKYLQAVQSNDYNWWLNDISSIHSKIKNGPKREGLIYKRVLSYLSLMMYLQTTQFMQQRNTAAAMYFSRLYLLVDPKNPEAYYLAAALNAYQGERSEALRYLSNAVDNGFENKTRLEKDSAFIHIRTSEGFQKIIQRVNKNKKD